MKNKRVVPAWITFVLIILLSFCIVYHGYMLFTTPLNFLKTTMYILGLIVDFSALIYCITQYKKSSAVYFRIFVICLYLIIAFYTYARARIMTTTGSVAGFVVTLINFAMLSVFVFAKDIGKERSLIYASIAMIAEIADTCLTFVQNGTKLGLSGLAGCVLYIVFVLVVYAKYKDKDARGTK